MATTAQQHDEYLAEIGLRPCLEHGVVALLEVAAKPPSLLEAWKVMRSAVDSIVSSGNIIQGSGVVQPRSVVPAHPPARPASASLAITEEKGEPVNPPPSTAGAAVSVLSKRWYASVGNEVCKGHGDRG